MTSSAEAKQRRASELKSRATEEEEVAVEENNAEVSAPPKRSVTTGRGRGSNTTQNRRGQSNMRRHRGTSGRARRLPAKPRAASPVSSVPEHPSRKRGEDVDDKCSTSPRQRVVANDDNDDDDDDSDSSSADTPLAEVAKEESPDTPTAATPDASPRAPTSPSGSSGRIFWKSRSAEEDAAQSVIITDVTAHRLTITVRESQTDKGFFTGRPPSKQHRQFSADERDFNAKTPTNG